jgi:DNA-directed RNA polymerase beta' subunit/intein/homing endonuclease
MLKLAMEWRENGQDEEGNKEQNIKKIVLSAEDVLQILRRISNRDAEILGFDPRYSRPEWMICTTFPVPPPSVRPSVRTDTGQRQEDDLTHKLLMIVKVNKNLQQKLEKSDAQNHDQQIDMWTMLLQYEIATMIDNTHPSIPTANQKTGRPIRSLTERLKSKEGRIRGNLMGKRVDYSARSVITPDPNLSIDELGVPLKIAMNMTYPEIVTRFNKEEMYKIVRNGPDVYPGAKHVKKISTGITKRLKNLDRESVVLEDGDVVDRHIRNGDYVLFNRQPSLHKLSMQSFRVRVMPYQTFRLNVCVTPSFNADFDGDEMNAIFSIGLQSMEELIQLCPVPTQIISPKDSTPSTAVVQDVATGLFRMTKSFVRISECQMMNIMSNLSRFDGNMPEPTDDNKLTKYWTGRQALSCILPKRVNVNIKSEYYDVAKTAEDKENNHVIIKNGQLISGAITKNVYQAGTRGVVHNVFNEYGPDETRHLFDNTQKLICDWFVYDGFSTGISDIIIPEKYQLEFKKVIHAMKIQAYDVIRHVHEGNFTNDSTRSNHTLFEDTLNNTILSKANSTVGNLALGQINDKYNRLINMIKPKSKGNNINVAQMIGCVGQQNVEGKRIPYGFDNRTLPHYTKYDDGPESRGFVENSFIQGLSPQEYFFHAMGGREGLIDTAVQSVIGDTPIIIIEDGKPKYVKIGDWIDARLDKNKDSVRHFEEKRMELLDLQNQIYIPTVDAKGNMSWGAVTAMTRHDPGTELYEIKTLGGRSVIVTASKSLLIWNDKLRIFNEIATPDVKVGDFVPVTATLPSPPIVITSFDMSEYFPKTEYIHGTEFNNASECARIAQGDKFHIPRGWWEANNGTTFTLPYTKKASLTRALVRSNTENIKNGNIYPYHATREQALIPEQFELNKENGIFIGLFLAEGCTCEKSGHVSIANIDEGVKAFVKKWFDKFSIKHAEDTRLVELGTSTSIIGNSTLLARFLDKFVGKGAANKYVPDVAFVAPEEFVIGILNGYISGDGCVSCKTSGCITSSSISQRLTEGISMLCSRIGVFGKISTRQQTSNNLGTQNIAKAYVFAIGGHWAWIFGSKVDLILSVKHDKLKKLSCRANHRNFEEVNDVVLDAIVEIIPIDATIYPKVYDLTIPSTLNFTISNGLSLYDTSETGYIQRKLVKAMEDCKVHYDMTVRNAGGVIVQYLYGEDGMDSCKIDSQHVSHIDMTMDQILSTYGMVKGIDDFKPYVSSDILKVLKVQKEPFGARMLAHLETVLADREFLIVNIHKGKKESTLMYPVSLQRIVTSIQNTYDACGVGFIGDLSPIYVLDKIDELCTELTVTKAYPGNYMFQVLIRAYLTPKRVIIENHLTKNSFDSVIEQIKFKFFEALVHPSEMVGVVAAQSIGEPATQLTLNTFHFISHAGATKAVRGVPRLNELLAFSKNIKTPVMKIMLKDSVSTDKLACLQIMNNIRTIRFKDVVKSSKIYFDPSDTESLIIGDREFIKVFMSRSNNNTQPTPWMLRMEFDRDAMLNFKLDMVTIHHVLSVFYDERISCIFSDDNADTLIMRIRIAPDENEKTKLSGDDILTDLKALEHNIVDVVPIKGIRNIKLAALEEINLTLYNAESKAFENKKEWMVFTEGTNIRDVLALSIVDGYRTLTNDVNEIYEVLGVEAARQVLYNEIVEVLDSINVNYRHIALLVDVMTNRGNILSVNRHGINRGDIGPLAKCSFEETTDKLIKAGIFSEFDKINGVSANVMLGQIAPCGTGDVTIIMDDLLVSKMPESTYQQDTKYDDDTTIDTCDVEIMKLEMPIMATVETTRKKNNKLVILGVPAPSDGFSA